MKFWRGTIYSINAAALILGAASLLSRILGVFRDRMLASQFGASRELDIYYAAFRIPDFIYTIFLLGAASVAIIPVFAYAWEENQEQAKKLMGKVLAIFLVSSILISLAVAVSAPFLAGRLFPGFGAEEMELLVRLIRIMMLSPILLGMSTIISTVTQYFRRFLVFALSGIFYNLGIIFGILFFLPRWGLPGLALGVILGALLHFLVQVPTLYRLGFKISFDFSAVKNFFYGKADQGVVNVWKLSFPRVVAMLATQVTLVFLVAMASKLAQGSIAIFQFAANLIYLPVGVFGASFSVAAFPALSAYFIRKDGRGFFETLTGTLQQVMFWVMPLAVLFYVLRAQIVRVALGAGKFSWEDTRLTAAMVGIMAAVVITESLFLTVIKSFYALGNTKKPLLYDLATSLFTIFMALVLIPIFVRPTFFSSFWGRVLRISDMPDMGVLALGLAFALGSAANLILLTRALIKEARLRLNFFEDLGWREMWEVVLASLFSGLASFGALRLANIFIKLDTFLGVFAQGAIAFFAGAFVYSGLLYISGNSQMKDLLETIRRRLVSLKVLPEEFNGTHPR